MRVKKNRKASPSSSDEANRDPLPKIEWYFEQVPEHLVHHCWLWEFCRELYSQNEELQGAVQAYWQTINEQDDWRRYVKHAGNWPTSAGSSVFTEENSVRSVKDLVCFESASGKIKFEEFVSSRPLTKKEISKILQRLADPADRLDRNWAELTRDGSTIKECILDLEKSHGSNWPQIIDTRREELSKTHPELSVELRYALTLLLHYKNLSKDCFVPHWVDWGKSNVELIREFRHFLAENRPNTSHPPESNGRPRTTERNQLKALGALRLLRHYGKFESVRNSIVLMPYCDDPSVWSRARSEAVETLDKLTKSLQNLESR